MMLSIRRWVGPAALLAVWIGVQAIVPELRGQAPTSLAPPTADAGAPLEKKPAPTLGEIIFGSDWIGLSFYAVLAVFSLVAMTATMERLVNLRRAKLLPPAFARRLQEMLIHRHDARENFAELCAAFPSPAASILKAGVLRAGRPLAEVEKGMEDAAIREMASIRARNRILTVAGNVAPLVGLLGTVVGMILSFRIASQVGTGKAEQLAEGIYVALLTTAGGLLIAIPCMLLAAWFNHRADRYFREIDECLMDALPSFGRMEDETVEVVAVPTLTSGASAPGGPGIVGAAARAAR